MTNTENKTCETFLKNYDMILKIIKLVVEIICFIFIVLIYNLGRKNTFDNQSIGEIYNYFYCYPNEYIKKPDFNEKGPIIFPMYLKYNRYNILRNIGRKINNVEDNNNLNEIFYECEDDFDSINITFCKDIYLSFTNHKGDKFSNIFELNSKYIKTNSLQTVINFIIYLIFYFPYITIELCDFFECKCVKNFTNDKTTDNAMIIISWKIMIYLSWISKILNYYSLWTIIENGDLEKYEKFLKCKYVKKKYFDENFPDIHNLRIYYITLLILNLTIEVFDKCESFFNFIIEKFKQPDN